MSTTSSARDVDRLALVSAAYRFLMDVVPFGESDSPAALETFVAAVGRIQLPPAEIDAVLLRCLAALDMQGERRIPSLVDRYLAKASTPAGSIAHFKACVQDLLAAIHRP